MLVVCPGECAGVCGGVMDGWCNERSAVWCVARVHVRLESWRGLCMLSTGVVVVCVCVLLWRLLHSSLTNNRL